MDCACYVPDIYGHAAYRHDSFDARMNAGLLMVRDAVQRSGVDVGYAGPTTVGDVRVLLCNITSASDWYDFIREQNRWQQRPEHVVVGGPGVLNVRPVLPWFDYAVLGRGESIAPALVSGLLSGNGCPHESMIEAASFDSNEQKIIAQAAECYPHRFRAPRGVGGKREGWYRETLIGCPRRCSFCAYTWHRKHVGESQFGEGFTVGSRHMERTIFDLIETPRKEWGRASLLVGLDGLSERLRLRAGKPITREMWREFLRRLVAEAKRHMVRVFNIVGYPGETEADRAELAEDIAMIDAEAPDGEAFFLLVQSTPFRAMPATPCERWPMSRVDHRPFLWGGAFKTGNLHQGRRIVATAAQRMESPAPLALDALILRGTEEHQPLIRKLCTTSAFWSASAPRKLATLEGECDLDALYAAIEPGREPAGYLHSWMIRENMARMDAGYKRKAGAPPCRT